MEGFSEDVITTGCGDRVRGLSQMRWVIAWYQIGLAQLAVLAVHNSSRCVEALLSGGVLQKWQLITRFP